MNHKTFQLAGARKPAPRFAVLLLAVVLLLGFNSAHAQPTNGATTLADLTAQIDAHIAQSKFAAATWGIKIVSLDTGFTLYENHADRLMSPASNSKLYTGALALVRFGGEHRIATPIFATAPVDASGALNGDLIISGRGDPSWNSRRLTNFWDIFEPFVTALTNAGVCRITGDIIGDATFFHGPPTGSSWTVDDLAESEGAIISALTLDDNVTQFRVAPGATPGASCVITPLQPGAGLTFSNQAVTVASNLSAQIDFYRPLGGNVIDVFGQLPVGGANQTLDIPVLEPAEWFAAALKIALQCHGIQVSGEARGIMWPQKPAWNPAALVKIGEVLSPPMKEMVSGFMKRSQNLETDIMLANVGELSRNNANMSALTSEEAGLAALRELLVTAGVAPGEFQFDEGSGLSRNNLTTADATVKLLQYMALQHNFTNRPASVPLEEGFSEKLVKNYMDALPIMGVDGTLRSRLKNTAAAGNVHAKTGTLRWAQAVSGYATSASGERLAFSIMLNRFVPTSGHSGHDEIDPLILMLVNFTGRSEESFEKTYAPFGTLIVKQFATAPFPHPARASGHQYHDEFYSAAEHYSDNTVAMFIPKNFRAADKVDFVVHFHGWRHTVASTLEEYKLIEQFSAAGKNAILIVPQGPRNAPDSFGGKLEDTNGFANFMAEAAATLRSSGAFAKTNFEIGTIILSGHSGGYHVMAAILDHGGLAQNIKEAWLFDALYGNTENFAAWQKNQNGRLLDIYTDHGGTKDESEKWMAALKGAGVPFFAAEDSAAAPDNLRTNKLVFLHSGLAHDDVVAKRDTFSLFLRTSCLENQ